MGIKDELLSLQQKAGGLLQVEPTVEWARQHPKSDLHAALDWDNESAGHSWRCQQVRRLIAIHIVSEVGTRQVVSLSIDRVQPQGGYRDLNDVMAAPDMREILLEDALNELARVRERYRQLKELAEIWEAIDRTRAKRGTKKKRA